MTKKKKPCKHKWVKGLELIGKSPHGNKPNDITLEFHHCHNCYETKMIVPTGELSVSEFHLKNVTGDRRFY